jgi:predicted ATP-binding protein involved in virulence
MATATASSPRKRRDVADWPKSLTVEGLFREGITREIQFHLRDRITILSGPNGSGKTRLLELLRAALALDWGTIAAEPFESLRLELKSGRTLIVRRTPSEYEVQLYVELATKRRKSHELNISLQLDPTAHLILPDYISRVGDELWEDLRDGELLSLEDLNIRFPERARVGTESSGWTIATPIAGDLNSIRSAIGRPPLPTLIETKRLDIRTRQARRQSRPPSLRRHPSEERHDRIDDYVDQIQDQVLRARSEYSRISQRIDSQFVSKALNASAEPIPNQLDLRKQYRQLATLHSEFLATGLVADKVGVEMPAGRLSATARRILTVFLDDWGAKLEPLVPVHEKLQMLQDIVGTKLKDKRIRLDETGRLRVETASGYRIPVNQLSSGEQHLLALFAMLLFSASQGSVVLIDEPEISLHAEWKHAFLTDIYRVAESANLQFVLATHSTGIVNGQWELVEQL